MLKWIEDQIGIKIKEDSWKEVDKLPLLYRDNYDFIYAYIGDYKSLFITPKEEVILPNIKTLIKQIAFIQKIENIPIAFFLNKTSKFRKETFIKERIPFVVPQKIIYLPFLGIVIKAASEKESNETKRKHFQPATQLVFLYYFYSNQASLYTAGLAPKLNVSEMTISRAVKELEETGLFTVTQGGLQNKTALSSSLSRKELFIQAQAFLISPVKKTFYTKKVNNTGYIKAGINALSHYSMINPEETECFAVKTEKEFIDKTIELIDLKNQSLVQVWKYDPALFAKEGYTDEISLYASFKSETDERIQISLEEMMNEYFEGINNG